MAFEFLAQPFGFLDFRSVLELWRAAGLFDVVLPFLLVFALVYAILEKSHILGENRGVYAVIALALAFFAVQNLFVTNFFISIFSNAALGFVVLLVFILLIGFVVGEGEQGWWKWFGGIAAVIIFFWVLSRTLSETGLITDWWIFLSNNPFIASLLIYVIPLLLVFILIMLPKGGESPIESLVRLFRGGGHKP